MKDSPSGCLEIRWALEELSNEKWRSYTRCESLFGDDGAIETIKRMVAKTQGATHSSGVLTTGITAIATQAVTELWAERIAMESRCSKDVLDVNTHLIQQFLHIGTHALRLLYDAISDN